jgi:hypothetical protein
MASGDHLPRRIILSRKGWDSSSGGGPSPIFSDGTLLTLPIPDCGSGVRFRDLRSRDNQVEIGSLVEGVTGGRVHGESELHLDPDLRMNAISRNVFQPAFGQVGTAQSHLEKKGVSKSTAAEDKDLFLFFGLYRRVQSSGGWRYVSRAPKLHVIFGWLQVDKILQLPGDDVPVGLRRHPHAIPSFIVEKELRRRSKSKQNNTIYLPREKLTFCDNLTGSGLFDAPFRPDADDPRCLSAPGQAQSSRWRLPSFFHGLSNMGTQPSPSGEFWEPQRKGYGQEFVLDVPPQNSEIHEWLVRLFRKGIAPQPKTVSATVEAG